MILVGSGWTRLRTDGVRRMRAYSPRRVADGDAVDGVDQSEVPVDGKRTVELTEDEALTIYRILNEVVVSLDRIGSREADGQDPDGRYISGYFGEDGATLRLAKARSAIIYAVERAFSEDELASIDDGIVYWTDLHPGL